MVLSIVKSESVEDENSFGSFFFVNCWREFSFQKGWMLKNEYGFVNLGMVFVHVGHGMDFLSRDNGFVNLVADLT